MAGSVARGAVAVLALVAASGAASARSTDETPPACAYDWPAMEALDYEAFDQDLAPGGWRALGARPECQRVAAELIARWREAHTGRLPKDQEGILWWHEGQKLAEAGDYEAAIPRLETARTFHEDPPPPADAPVDEVEMWRANLTVRDAWEDATLAFLRRDREALIAARDRMLAVLEPAGFSEFQDWTEQKMGVRMRWPLNIEGVEQMVACFDQRYGTACPSAAGRAR